jgi:hypothetical protein
MNPAFLQLPHARLAGRLRKADPAGKLRDRDPALRREDRQDRAVVAIQIVHISILDEINVQVHLQIWSIGALTGIVWEIA